MENKNWAPVSRCSVVDGGGAVAQLPPNPHHHRTHPAHIEARRYVCVLIKLIVSRNFVTVEESPTQEVSPKMFLPTDMKCVASAQLLFSSEEDLGSSLLPSSGTSRTQLTEPLRTEEPSKHQRCRPVQFQAASKEITKEFGLLLLLESGH